MYYISFRLIDPYTCKIRYTGIKYKKTPFSEEDIQKIRKTGTSNKEVKQWIRTLRENKQLPAIEILYQGQSSKEACYKKQQDIINHLDPKFQLIAPKIKHRKYTKKLHKNEDSRTPIVDQNGTQYSGVLDAAEKLFIAPSNISKVLHGHLDHASGYSFSFV